MRWRPKSNRGKSSSLVEQPRASGAFDNEHFDKLFLRPSPIGSASLDADRLLGRPPLTRAPVHDDLDVLPSGENASNLVFEMAMRPTDDDAGHPRRSEEHTSELQSQSNLVCRLLLEKKK